MEEDWEPRHILVRLKNGARFAQMLDSLTSRPEEWSPFVDGDEIDCDRFHSDPDVLHLRRLLRGLSDCAKFLDADRRLLDQFTDLNQLLCSPERLGDFGTFVSLLKTIRTYLNAVNKKIEVKLARMSMKECARIDEAMVCLRHYCYYASTVMSVSAVECRLHTLIKRVDKTLYNKEFRKATVGEIIHAIGAAKASDPKTASLVGLIPDRHMPLVKLLNVYRIYSAHAKEQEVTAPIAESVLLLSCSFLTDPAMVSD